MDMFPLTCKVEPQLPEESGLLIPPYYSIVQICTHCRNLLCHPIYACVNDHILCDSCAEISDICDICHESIYNLRVSNQQKFNDLPYTYYKCCYQKKGCTTLSRKNHIESHENSCIYGLQECPFQFMTCRYFGTERNLFNHLVEQHSITSENKGSFDLFFFHKTKGYIFRFTGTQALCGGVTFYVCYVGSIAKSKKFKYCLRVKSLNGKRSDIYFIGSCKSVWEEDSKLENSNSNSKLFIPYPEFMHYFHNTKFKIQVEIAKLKKFKRVSVDNDM